MNITLRKANALQLSIQEAIRAIEVKGTVDLNQFQGDSVLGQARDTAVTNDVRRANLTRVLYEIRAAVGEANVSSGVSRKLAHAAFIDKRVAQLQALVASENVQTDSAVIQGRLEELRNIKSDHRLYGYRDNVTTGVFTAADVDSFRGTIQALKREKQKLNDEVLELNVRTEIALSESIVQLLQQENLV